MQDKLQGYNRINPTGQAPSVCQWSPPHKLLDSYVCLGPHQCLLPCGRFVHPVCCLPNRRLRGRWTGSDLPATGGFSVAGKGRIVIAFTQAELNASLVAKKLWVMHRLGPMFSISRLCVLFGTGSSGEHKHFAISTFKIRPWNRSGSKSSGQWPAVYNGTYMHFQKLKCMDEHFPKLNAWFRPQTNTSILVSNRSAQLSWILPANWPTLVWGPLGSWWQVLFLLWCLDVQHHLPQ